MRMANLPLSISLNWKAILIGLLVFASTVWYFSHYFWRPSPRAKQNMITTGFLKIGDNSEAIFYRHVAPEKSKLNVLFLHGQAFTSKTWEDIGTLEFLGKKGYRVMAIDLPSYGNSKLELPKTPAERAKLVDRLFDLLEMKNPVLVVPSMSGSFALPFIFDGENAKKLRGFVPVAPVNTNKYDIDKYKGLNLKTMIIYGQNDQTLGLQSLERLKNIPHAMIRMVDEAGHACYMNNTAEFHSYLEEFLKSAEDTLNL